MLVTMNYFDEAATTWDDQPHRVRLMKTIGESIVREAAPTKDMAVLDYGCGTGLVGLYLLSYVRTITGADSSLGMLEILRSKIDAGGLKAMKVIQLDLEKDDVPADRYDMIVTGMAMHHIANTDRVLNAFHEMLVPGGMVCIADLDTEPGTFHTGQSAASVHHRGFDRQELKQRLKRAGFANASDSTVVKFRKPVDSGGDEEFSIFLITARRS
jgi:ubiquinone/menaquinone biosynthesis C-methylase UbiE